MPTIAVDKQTIRKMKEHYKAHLKSNPPQYSEFAAKKAGVTITAYTSGKVLFQGKNAEIEATRWGKLQPAKTKTAKVTSPLPDGFEQWSVLGSDEVGTGSYFGPLTVCAAYVSRDHIELVKELGVRDSKHLSDKNISEIANQIITFLPYSLLVVWPEKYNAIQPTMTQGKMKALLHNQVLQNVLSKIKPEKPDGILIDQFVAPTTYFKHIKDEKTQVKEKVYFATKGESHHLAVAAASIIARASFVDGLETLSKQAGITLPSGAHGHIDQAAAKVVLKEGPDSLRKYAKLHFANTKRALELAKKTNKK